MNIKILNRKFVFFLVLLQLLLSVGCTKKDFTIKNLNNDKIEAMGHGGMGTKVHCPINTLKSVQTCIDAGAEGTEIDVQMTKDEMLVAFHDETLNLATKHDGQIAEKNWSEISGAKYNTAAAKRHELKSMEDLLNCLEFDDNFLFTLDVKTTKDEISKDYANSYVQKISALIDKFNLSDQVLVEFNRVELAKAMRKLRPDIKVFIYNEYDFALEKAVELGAFGITCSVDWLTKEQVEKAHENNIRVTLFGCNSNKKNIKAIELNPDYIQTDELKHLLRVLN